LRVGIWLGLHVFSKPDDGTGTRSGEASSGRQNLTLQSDTVWCFSGEFVMIQEDGTCCKALIIKAGIMCEDEVRHKELSPNGEGLFLMPHPLFHPVNPVHPVEIPFFNCIVPT
jgi:hypothetical protein